MPRKPTFDHPVRRLRETIGLTQHEFARLVGVSKDAIQSVENGRLSLSKHLAFKIRHQTGCVLKCIVNKDESETFEVRNLSAETLRGYTAEDFKAHQEMLSEFLGEDFEHTATAASRCIALLLRIAAERGAGTVQAICDDFEQFVTSSFESYKLAPKLAGLLRKEWAEYNDDLDIERTTKQFPVAPLSTAYSFPIEAVIGGVSTTNTAVKNPGKAQQKLQSTRKAKA